MIHDISSNVSIFIKVQHIYKVCDQLINNNMICLKCISMQYRPFTREVVQLNITYTKTLLNCLTKLCLKIQQIVSFANILKKINLPLDTHACMNAWQSFWIMKVYQSPAFLIILNIFLCVTRSLTVFAKVWRGLNKTSRIFWLDTSSAKYSRGL